MTFKRAFSLETQIDKEANPDKSCDVSIDS